MPIQKMLPLLLVLATLAPLPVLAANTMSMPTDTMSPPTPTKKGGSSKSGKSTTVIVNVNTDSSVDLQKVKGIGEATAKKIIAGRPYATLDDLLSKKALTPKQLATLKPQLTVK